MSEAPPFDATSETTIPRLGTAARAADDTAFAALRAYAVERAQAASGRVWTDYNLHDPGLTILEAVCFALTDLVYQADFPVADHLCGPDGTIAFERQALFPPQSILPCRATTAADWRRVILDRAPGLRDARPRPAAEPSRAGLYDLALLSADDTPLAKAACSLEARAAGREQRGLAEDFDTISEIRIDYCTLRLQCGVGGPRDPADVVAEIYDVCAVALEPPVVAHSIEALIEAGRSIEEIFTGPSVVAGIIEAATPPLLSDDGARPGRGPSDELVLNGLRAQLLAIDGVTSITGLSLTKDSDGQPETRRLAWDGEVTAMRLKTPSSQAYGARDDRHDADVSLVRVTRGAAEVLVDPDDVAACYADRRAGRDEGRRPDTRGAAGLRLPRGAPRAPRPYFSLQNLLPPIYRLGANRPPAESSLLAALAADAALRAADPQAPERKVGGAAPPAGLAEARVVQLKTYLALFDQIIANASVQIDHIGDLMTPEAALGQSYWRGALTNASVSQIEALYGGRTPAQVAEAAFGPYDDVLDRRGRALDFLLALYGEQLAQNTQRQFLGYLDSIEQAKFLLRNKAEFLTRIDVLTRDRTAGFDYGQALWGPEDHTPGFQRRLALLLGFSDPRARPLATPRALRTPSARGARGAAAIDQRPLSPALPLEWPETHAEISQGSFGLGTLGPKALPHVRGITAETWFELGLDRQNYVWRLTPDDQAVLWLGRDAGAGRPIGVFDTPQAAAEAAQMLRDHMLALTAACEGVHVVEHILLRPRGPRAPRRLSAYTLRVTLVFPGWTARTGREDFHAFAQETADISCPAHVAAQCLWLDIPDMQRFETLYGEWLTHLETHARSEPEALNTAAMAVTAFLRQALRRQRRRPAPRQGGA